MTGEITLRGKVLPVGGNKEKVLAARRAGVTRILLPKHNEKDLEDVQPELRRNLEFVFVEDIDAVISAALVSDAIRPESEFQDVASPTPAPDASPDVEVIGNSADDETTPDQD